MIELDDGRPIRVTGDRSSKLYGGYTCIKGRALPDIHLNPERLLFSLKKNDSGRHQRIATEVAIAEIADKLSNLIEQYGPSSIAIYYGNSIVPYPVLSAVAAQFMVAIDSPMSFSAATLDQPGIPIANALHGKWAGGRIASEQADATLIVGGNPVISKQYLSQNPARCLKDRVKAGMKLVVIDPRRTESARRAHVHLQVRPGEDACVIAGILHLLIREGAVDESFVSENVEGLDQLTRALEPFTPQFVAARADIKSEALIEAADILAQAERADIAGGTGISMTGHGNLCFYLLLCLQSVRGFWAREGDRYTASGVLTAKSAPKAQATAPTGVFTGRSLRTRNLKETVAGFPTSGLAEEILTPGEGRIKALICLGNPLSAWPDTKLAERAMKSLDLLVVPNVEYSETAQVADYVLATKQILETPATTQLVEITRAAHPGYGWDVPYAHYTSALLDEPKESDLIEEWQIFFRIAQLMGRPLRFHGADGQPCPQRDGEPTTDELIDMLCQGSGVAIEKVRQKATGHVFEEQQEVVAPRDPDCTSRLNVADQTMLQELALIAESRTADETSTAYPYLLVTRRADGVVNSMFRRVPGIHKRTFNPAYMAPTDIKNLGLKAGSLVAIASHHGKVTAVLQSDDTLRPGTVSISHGYGPAPDEDDDPRLTGTNVNRLLRMDVGHDPISGLPRMGAVAVSVEPAEKP